MSGLFKGIGKVFRRVGKVLKKIALPALAIGAVMMTGGMGAGLMPALGMGGAAAGTAATAGATAASGGGLGGFLSGIFGGGGAAAGAAGVAGAAAPAVAGGGGFLGALGRGIGGFVSSPIGGQIIQGAAQGWSNGAVMREEEEQSIRAEERLMGSYEGAGAAMLGSTPRGLAPRTRPGRSAGASTAPRWRWNATTRQMDYN